MPLFYFNVKTGSPARPDTEGEVFADETGARAHAHAVASELMRSRETRTAHWRIQVCDDYLALRYECLFADIDPTLEGYDEDLRRSVTAAARTKALVSDALEQINAGMLDLRQTLHRIDFILSHR
jgi:hypothetical protein